MSAIFSFKTKNLLLLKVNSLSETLGFKRHFFSYSFHGPKPYKFLKQDIFEFKISHREKGAKSVSYF